VATPTDGCRHCPCLQGAFQGMIRRMGKVRIGPSNTVCSQTDTPPSTYKSPRPSAHAKVPYWAQTPDSQPNFLTTYGHIPFCTTSPYYDLVSGRDQDGKSVSVSTTLDICNYEAPLSTSSDAFWAYYCLNEMSDVEICARTYPSHVTFW